MLADWVIGFFPQHRVYTEVFGGAASVLLKKPRVHSEIYNDLDDGVVNLFRVLRNQKRAHRLSELIYLTTFSRTEFEKSYGPEPKDPIERARQLIVRSYQGFGSDSVNKARATGYRINGTREGASPGGDWRNYPAAIPAVVERLRGVMIENKPAIEVLKRFDMDDTLHYVDPPYLPETRSNKPGIYAHEMTSADHEKLLGVLTGLKGYVVVSGYASDLYERTLKGWGRYHRKANLNMGLVRTEVLWLNPKADDVYKDGRLL